MVAMTETPMAGQADARRGFDFTRPSTRTGLWSLGLGIVFVVMMTVNMTVLMNLQSGIVWRPALIGFGLVMMAAGLASGVLAAIAVFRQHERSIFVLLPAVAGLFVLIFLVGEFAFPH